MISEEQIQDIIDSNEVYSKEYFIWLMNPENTDIEQFYLEKIEPELEDTVIALMLETDNYYSDCKIAIDKYDWLVLTDDEANEECRKYAENSADDALHEIPIRMQEYFNVDMYIEDVINSNSRGELLSTYDGAEYEQEVNGTTYYLYRR